MSDSRLEKFIYAICSMDVTDLPVPLSRIEKLWNCLITGETPDFEPQSRNEQYLMAMLGLYELENLPTPMSRGEKLLYKIAVGETDLSDVPGYLSRYEELLKYLIENGGIGFEYVLYTLNQSLSTLYNTAEKPVKSAILKGQTLVNVLSISNVSIRNGSSYSYNYNITPQVGEKYLIKIKINSIGVTTNTYPVKIQPCSSTGGGYFNITEKEYCVGNEITKIFTIVDGDNITNGTFTVWCRELSSGEFNADIIMIKYQDGMENWDIPYFEGMQSVQMPVLTTTGKNLFDIRKATLYTNPVIDIISPNDFYLTRTNPGEDCPIRYKNLKEGSYILSGECVDGTFQFVRISNGVKTYSQHLSNVVFNITINDGDEVGIVYHSVNKKMLFNNIQIAQTQSPYEPYKSNILTTSEEVVLKGIGDVKDTLNLNTGEMVERIGEVVLDGSEKWSLYISKPEGYPTEPKTIKFACDVLDKKSQSIASVSNLISNKFKVTSADFSFSKDEESISERGKSIRVVIEREKLITQDIYGFKLWLSQNPITVQYLLETESVKTVDLTTVDQDGHPTKLKTFNDITHVEIKADNLIPSVDLEVATKISETLSTMGLQHHDISETQNELGQTIEEQSENTDAAMIATTEIYEQTL